jgi:hypothetical protein
MELDGSAARSGESWPALVEDHPALRAVSPRSLIVRGPVTRPARRAKARTGSEAVVEPPIVHLSAPSRPAHTWWRAGAVTVVAAAAAALLVIAGEPAAADRVEAAPRVVEAAAPEPATVVMQAAPVAAPADPDVLAEEVLYVEDDDEPEDDARDEDRSDRRARARNAARSTTARARARRSSGDIAAAEALYREALAALPTYGPAAADLATLHIHRGQYREALAYAKRAARSAPRKLSYMILLGDAHHLIGDRRAAETEWRRAADYGSAKGADRLAKHARVNGHSNRPK